MSNVILPSGTQPGLGGQSTRNPDTDGTVGQALRVASVADHAHAMEWFSVYDTATVDGLINDVETTPGPAGEKGEPGYGFEIETIYNSVAELQNGSVTPGRFGLVAGTLDESDDDYGKLYLYDGSSWTYITDMSVQGAAGVQGPKGDDGADSGLADYLDASTSGGGVREITPTAGGGINIGRDDNRISKVFVNALLANLAYFGNKVTVGELMIQSASGSALLGMTKDNSTIGINPSFSTICGLWIMENAAGAFKNVTVMTTANGGFSVVSPAHSSVFLVDTDGTVTTSSGIKYRSGSSDPTTSDILDGCGTRWKNTTNDEIRDWVNDGGTLKKSAAYS